MVDGDPKSCGVVINNYKIGILTGQDWWVEDKPIIALCLTNQRANENLWGYL